MLTGFVYKTAERSFEANSNVSVAVQRPTPSGSAKLAFRAFSEMDLMQLRSLADIVEKRDSEL